MAHQRSKTTTREYMSLTQYEIVLHRFESPQGKIVTAKQDFKLCLVAISRCC